MCDVTRDGPFRNRSFSRISPMLPAHEQVKKKIFRFSYIFFQVCKFDSFSVLNIASPLYTTIQKEVVFTLQNVGLNPYTINLG